MHFPFAWNASPSPTLCLLYRVYFSSHLLWSVPNLPRQLIIPSLCSFIFLDAGISSLDCHCLLSCQAQPLHRELPEGRGGSLACLHPLGLAGGKCFWRDEERAQRAAAQLPACRGGERPHCSRLPGAHGQSFSSFEMAEERGRKVGSTSGAGSGILGWARRAAWNSAVCVYIVGLDLSLP